MDINTMAKSIKAYRLTADTIKVVTTKGAVEFPMADLDGKERTYRNIAETIITNGYKLVQNYYN